MPARPRQAPICKRCGMKRKVHSAHNFRALKKSREMWKKKRGVD